MWSYGTVPYALCQGVGTWPKCSHHLVSGPSSLPTLLTSTLLASLATWAQVRVAHVPPLPVPYQCAYKLPVALLDGDCS